MGLFSESELANISRLNERDRNYSPSTGTSTTSSSGSSGSSSRNRNTSSPAPTSSSNTDYSGDPLGAIANLKKMWETNQMDGTSAGNAASPYYNQLTDYGYSPDEVAKIRDMDSAGVSGYNSNMKNTTTAPINPNIQNTGSPSVTRPSNNGGASTPAQPEVIKGPDGTIYGVKLADGTFMPYKQAGAAPTGAAAAIPAAGQVIQQQQNQSSTSNDLMKMFQSALQTAGNPNDAYWSPFKDLANQQATGIVQGKQQQLDAARSGIDDQFFQQYLGERQKLANRGLGNSGLANDSDFRLQLAKQGQLADMYSKLGTFDKDSIAADQFKGLYDSTNKTLIDKANSLQQAYGNAAQYDKINTSDILKTLFNYDQLGTQDKWKDIETKYNYDKMSNDNTQNAADRAQKDAQFNQKLSLDQQTELAKLGFQYDNMDEQHRQFYDKLDNDKLVEAAKDRVEWAKVGLDATKVYGVDEKGNLTLDAKKLAEEVRSHQAGETFNYDKLGAEVANWTKQNDLASSKYNLSRDSLAEKTNYDNSMIDKAKDATGSEMTKMALDGMKTQMNEVRQRIDDKLKADPKADVSDLITKSDNISKEITGLINSGKPAGGK